METFQAAVVPFRATAADLTEIFFAGRSANTVEAYKHDLRDFQAFVRAQDLREAARGLLSLEHGAANALGFAYRAWLIERDLKPATVNRRLAALRSIIKMANTFGLVPWQLDVKGVKARTYRDTRGPGRRCFEDALKSSFNRADGKGTRDAAIIRLLHDLGLRRKEVIGLDLADLQLKEGLIWILGKGKTEKEVLSLPQATQAALLGWLKLRGDYAGPLFPNFDRASQGNGRITGRAVHKLCQKHGFRPHGLRHTAITEALDRTGGDVRAAQRFSRHRNIQTLLVYDDNRMDIGGRVARMVAGDE